MTKKILFIAVFVLIGFSTSAQEEISINQFSWLTGHWIGDGFGGESEEIWERTQSRFDDWCL